MEMVCRVWQVWQSTARFQFYPPFQEQNFENRGGRYGRCGRITINVLGSIPYAAKLAKIGMAGVVGLPEAVKPDQPNKEVEFREKTCYDEASCWWRLW